MNKIENTQGIARISFSRTVYPFCPLGGDYYSAEVNAEIIVGRYYPDYIELDKAIQELGGQDLIIEDLAQKAFEIIETYEPQGIRVVINANSNTHFPVTVEKVG